MKNDMASAGTLRKNDDIPTFGLKLGPKANITPTPDIHQDETGVHPCLPLTVSLNVSLDVYSISSSVVKCKSY